MSVPVTPECDEEEPERARGGFVSTAAAGVDEMAEPKRGAREREDGCCCWVLLELRMRCPGGDTVAETCTGDDGEGWEEPELCGV